MGNSSVRGTVRGGRTLKILVGPVTITPLGPVQFGRCERLGDPVSTEGVGFRP